MKRIGYFTRIHPRKTYYPIPVIRQLWEGLDLILTKYDHIKIPKLVIPI